jgi:cytoskeletal protein CcmA (bactofilin family)
MPKDELPSLDDFTENPVELPSVDEFITEEKVVEELPSVDEYIVDIEEKVIYEKPNLPSIEEKIVDESLPTIGDYIEEDEEEEEVVEEDIETTGGISVQEYSPDMKFRDYEFIDIIKKPEWKELLGLVNEVRDSIPDIPEIKYYDDDLEKISETIEEVRSQIPVVPEVKYYDEEIENVKQLISELPEVKYYDEQVNELDNRIDNLPEVKYYDDDLNAIKDKFNYEIQQISESIEVKDFETRVDVDNVRTNLKETSEKIYEELKKSSDQIHEYRLHLKDDDRKLKKQILGQYNILKENIDKKVKDFNDKNIESQNVITNSLKEYFDELQDKITNLSEVKYYDKDIKEVKKDLSKLRTKFDDTGLDISELRNIVKELKEAQKQNLQENLLSEPPDTDNEDPLTPLDQNFVTLDQLQEHYRLFVNRVQQQLASFGGGGETKLQYLDDIVGVATNLSAYNGYVLKIDTSLDAPYKFKFAAESGGGGTGYFVQNSTGINTTSNVGIGTTTASDALTVKGDVNVTGVLTATSFTVGGTSLAETIADTVGGMVGSNTETGITVTYEDGDNTLDFVVGTLNQDTTGTADNFTCTANNSTDETVYPVFVDGATGSQGGETDTGFTYNPSDGNLTATTFTGALTGNVTGNASGSSGSCTGNAAGLTGTPNITVGDVVAASLDISGNTDVDGTLEADAITVDGTALNEYIADTVGAMVSSNTESGITVAYQDGDNTLDFTVGTLNQDTTGTADNITVSANNSTDETVYPIFVDGATGSQGAESDTGLTYNPSDGNLTSTTFTGNLTGNVTGNTSGSSGSCTGNAAGLTGTPNITVGDVVAASLDISGNTDIDGTLEADAITVDGTALNEYIADTIGAMVGSNTETGITVTYEDSDNTLDFVVGTLNQNTTGTAGGLSGTPNITVGDVVAASLDISGNTDIDGTLEADAITVDGTALNEYIADTVGGMVSSNTESGITVAYQDADNTLDFTVGTLNQDTTGTADNITVTANNSTDETVYPIFVDGATGSQGAESDTGLTYNPSDGNLTAITFVGDVVGVAATFTGDVSVGGTLTYEDVTNIDSVGLITARSGIDIGSPSVVRIDSGSSTKTSTSQASVDSFTASSYRSAQYQVQITRGSLYQMTTINVLHDGTNAYLSEFGTIKTGSNLATFDADINSGSLRLLATPTTSDSTVFKIIKTLTAS